MEKITGYKVFNPDWTCRGFKFEVGQTYEMQESPIACQRGFHFCTKAIDCFNYYSFDSNNKVALVESVGEFVTHEDDSKVATNKIVIVKELNWHEVLELVNTGKNNTGNSNSGDSNSGYSNSGYSNSGNSNSGDRNSGDSNSGYRNSGDSNSGYRNSGYRNSGFGNKSNFQTGVFNTTEGNVRLFNVEFNMSPSDFYDSEWYDALIDGGFELNMFIYSENMTNEEKEKNPKYETLCGYLKTISYKEAWAENWKNKSDSNKELVKQMPNFNAEIFFEITGIDLR